MDDFIYSDTQGLVTPSASKVPVIPTIPSPSSIPSSQLRQAAPVTVMEMACGKSGDGDKNVTGTKMQHTSGKTATGITQGAWLEICRADYMLVVRGQGTYILKDALKTLYFKWNAQYKVWANSVYMDYNMDYIESTMRELVSAGDRATIVAQRHQEKWKKMYGGDRGSDIPVPPEKWLCLAVIDKETKIPTARVSSTQNTVPKQSCSYQNNAKGSLATITVTSTVVVPVVGMKVTITNSNGSYETDITDVGEGGEEFVCEMDISDVATDVVFYIAKGKWKCSADRNAMVKLG